MSSSSTRRIKEHGGGGTKVAAVQSTRSTRSTTPVSEKPARRTGDPVNNSTGKENTTSGGISSRPTSRIRAAAALQKPVVPPMARVNKDSVESRARWSTSSSVRSRGRSSSPSEFNVKFDVPKTRVSRVSVDRNERSASVDRSSRVSDRVLQRNNGPSKYSDAKSNEVAGNGAVDSKDSVTNSEKITEICKELKSKPVKTADSKVTVGLPHRGRGRDVATRPESLSTQSGGDSVVKVAESVKLFEKFKSKSCVGLRSSNVTEKEENVGFQNTKDSSGKLLNRSSNSDCSKEKGGGEESVGGRANPKYPSKLHGKLAFLEEKVKRIASDIKRTKELLDLNNPDASKMMLSDIQDTVAGIEKAMGDVVNVEKEKKSVANTNGSDSHQIVEAKTIPVKGFCDTKTLAKGLNTDELEERFFPHNKLLRDRTTLKASSGSHQTDIPEVAVLTTESKQEDKKLSLIDENLIAHELLDSLSNEQSKISTKRGAAGAEICEVQETDGTDNSAAHRSSNVYNGKGNVETMLTANETLEESDEQENQALMIFEEEVDEGCTNLLNEIGHKTSTGGWFVSEGESVLLAHDDGSCTFYDVANSEEKSVYKPPAETLPNLWRDCWILRAPGADGCSGRYVVAASAGNSLDSGFCSWDFYTKEAKAFHMEDGLPNTTRTALAPLPDNVLNRRHTLSNVAPETRQWWYRPCGPLIVSTATNQRAVRMYDIRDGEHILKWEVHSPVLTMDYSSPLQWRNRGKVVVAEAEGVSLWDVGSLSPQPLLSVSSFGRKISALHINNPDAELGGGVRQRVSSSEAEGNDGVFCTPDSINVLDFRHPSGIGLKIPKFNTTAHSVFSCGDSIYLGCTTTSPDAVARKPPPSSHQIHHFSLRKQKLAAAYALPDSTAHPHYRSITQVWANSGLVMGVCGLGLFVFDTSKDDGGPGESVGPDDLDSPTFDYVGSRALIISRDRPAMWRYLS